MKKTFIVIAVVSVLLTVFAACVNEQYPQPDDISAVPEGMITVDEAKIYFFRHSDGSVSALNRDRLYLQNAFFAASGGDTAGVLTKTFATSSRSGLPLWEEAVVIVNPKYSTLRVPLSENVSGISRIGFGDDKNRIEYREARTRSSLIVQMLHEDGRIRQYVETVIRSDRSLTGDSYVLITDVAGEFLWCDRWKNGKRTDMALVGSSLPSSASADNQKLLLYGISLRSIWDTNELGEVGVPARPCPSCRHDPCTCCYRCGHDPCVCCTKCNQYPCECLVCPYCGSKFCDGKQCQAPPDKPDPGDPGGSGSDRPESPGFPLVNMKMDTATQKKLNKLLKKIHEDCMGQKLLAALNYNFNRELTIKYDPDIMVTARVNGVYTQSTHTITIGTESLSTFTEELFHAYQGYDPAKPYTTDAKLNYEVEAKVAVAQIKRRAGEFAKGGSLEREYDEMFLSYAKAPSATQYTQIVYILRKIGYKTQEYPESPAYRNIDALKSLSVDCKHD